MANDKVILQPKCVKVPGAVDPEGIHLHGLRVKVKGFSFVKGHVSTLNRLCLSSFEKSPVQGDLQAAVIRNRNHRCRNEAKIASEEMRKETHRAASLNEAGAFVC